MWQQAFLDTFVFITFLQADLGFQSFLIAPAIAKPEGVELMVCACRSQIFSILLMEFSPQWTFCPAMLMEFFPPVCTRSIHLLTWVGCVIAQKFMIFLKTDQSIGNLGVRPKVGVAMLVSQGEVHHLLRSCSVIIYRWKGGTLWGRRVISGCILGW